MFLLLRVLACITALCLCLYAYIDQHNAVTRLRLEIPGIKRDLREIEERNVALRYEIERFESPAHLMELSRQPRFAHLRYPSKDEISRIEVQDE